MAGELPAWATRARGPLDLGVLWQTGSDPDRPSRLTVAGEGQPLGPDRGWRNHGGPDRRIYIEVTGDALTAGCLAPIEAVVRVGLGREYRQPGSEVVPRHFQKLRADLVGDDDRASTSLDIALPAGFTAARNFDLLKGLTDADGAAAFEVFHNADIAVGVYGNTSPGVGTAVIRVTIGTTTPFVFENRVEVRIPGPGVSVPALALAERAPSPQTFQIVERWALGAGRGDIAAGIGRLRDAVTAADERRYQTEHRRLMEVAGDEPLGDAVQKMLALSDPLG